MVQRYAGLNGQRCELRLEHLKMAFGVRRCLKCLISKVGQTIVQLLQNVTVTIASRLEMLRNIAQQMLQLLQLVGLPWRAGILTLAVPSIVGIGHSPQISLLTAVHRNAAIGALPWKEAAPVSFLYAWILILVARAG